VYREAKTGETVAVKFSAHLRASPLTCTSCVNLLPGRTKILNECGDLVAILDEFGGRLFEEMDSGGENAERFAQLYGHLKMFISRRSTGNIASCPDDGVDNRYQTYK